MRNLTLLAAGLFTILILNSSYADWGFFAHRRINRMAAFRLPPELIGFYKKHIEYVTEHAVDPDKRRYATRHEAVRHYIDIDHWGEYPFPEVPRDWTEALIRYTSLFVVDRSGDTIQMQWDTLGKTGEGLEMIKLSSRDGGPVVLVSRGKYRYFFQKNIMPRYYEEEWIIDCDSLATLVPEFVAATGCRAVFAIDRFSEYGILPYHLLHMQRQLTEAFRQRSVDRILRLSAEMGHYIGDAHVPLHTTENYNGQLTGQTGIHAFWESRLPELFADNTYDFFVGKAQYINDPKEYFWKTVLASHKLVDSVLVIEKKLSQTFPQDKQYCYEERLDLTVRTQCREYSKVYHEKLNGMVEQRMQDAIRSIGNSWYTAWVDAGQPDLSGFRQDEISASELQLIEKLESARRQRDPKGRKHE